MIAAVSRSVPRTFAATRRGLSGMGVHKNKFFEEYNGVREVTYKSFRFDERTTPAIAVGLFGFGVVCYHFMKKEAVTRDQAMGVKQEYGAAPRCAP